MMFSILHILFSSLLYYYRLIVVIVKYLPIYDAEKKSIWNKNSQIIHLKVFFFSLNQTKRSEKNSLVMH